VRLRLLTDTIGKDIKSAVEKSDLQNIDIKVDADTAKADAELEATKREADGLDGKSPKITPKVDSKQAKKETSLLFDAIVGLGPAIGPLGAAATAAFAATAAGAGVAVLAVLGVKKEMAAGTVTGTKFSTGLQTLQGDLSTLEKTAARGILPGFQQTVTALNSSLPGVNKSVGTLSVILGDVASHVVVGLVSGLQTFEPLLTHIAQEADIAAQHFQAWATGPGGASFAGTLGKQFDLVVPVLVHLTEAVGKLIAAFVPIGDNVVGVFGALAGAINAVPLPVLKVLADLFVTLYGANRLLTLFNNLSLSLVKFGASAGVASVGMGTLAVQTATFTAAMGPVAAILLTGYTATQLFSNQLDKVANSFATGKIAASQNVSGLQELSTAYWNATGAADATSATLLKFALSGQKVSDGTRGLGDKTQELVSHFKTLGVTSDDVTAAVGSNDAAFQGLIDRINKHGGATKDDIKALTELHRTFQGTIDIVNLTAGALTAMTNAPGWGALKTNADSVTQLGAKFNLSAQSIDSFAAVLGISKTAIKDGLVTNKQLADAVQTVSNAYNTATATGAGFLDSLQKFSTSAGTAADRAQLIGAYLKASQGDLLSYSSAVASAYQANYALTDSFKQQADQVKAGTLALGATEKAAITLKTGLIDVTKQGAGPLIQQLQAMQDAALAAASATYQHEVATKGAGKAAADAADIFKNQTFNALVADAKQLGLTKTEAEKLATAYFDVPKDVKTKVAAIGTDPVVTVLNKIGELLAYMVGKPWNPKVSAPGAGKAKDDIHGVNDALHGLHGKTVTVGADVSPADRALAALNERIINMRPVITATVHVGATSGAGKLAQFAAGGLIQYRAAGGPSGRVVGPGTGTSDTAGLFALSNGEYVTNAASTKKYLPLLRAINQDQGMAAGGVASSAGGGGGTDWGAVAAAIAAEFRQLRFELVASNGGLPLAKVVNDANKVNARRLGQ